MKYIIIDALLNGTGIRDKYKGEYIDPCSLGLSNAIIIRLNDWLSDYWEEHYNGYIDGTFIDTLDQEGRRIAISIQKELPEMKVEYFSDARMTSEMIWKLTCIIDAHNGGVWKVFEVVGRKLKRIGTADETLTIFKN